MKDVTGYQPNAPINPSVIVSNLPTTRPRNPLVDHLTVRLHHILPMMMGSKFGL
jgi:hypothetical protein